jgi:hypothetical protein
MVLLFGLRAWYLLNSLYHLSHAHSPFSLVIFQVASQVFP